MLHHFCLSVCLCLVKTTILNYQSPTTGLFPVKTCSTCKEAKVRDSLYCAASAWALAMAYRLVPNTPEHHKSAMQEVFHCHHGTSSIINMILT